MKRILETQSNMTRQNEEVPVMCLLHAFYNLFISLVLSPSNWLNKIIFGPRVPRMHPDGETFLARKLIFELF